MKDKFERYLELVKNKDNETIEEQMKRKLLWVELMSAKPPKEEKKSLKLKKKKRK